MVTRRTLLQSIGAGGLLSLLPFRISADDARQALTRANLIYVTPVQSSGALSSCQSEVWYVMQGADIYVCTGTSSWRAQAPRRGLQRTKIWVGDLGYWKRADYESLPSVMADAGIESDAERIEAALQAFGRKYSAEWGKWERRFRGELADGSRAMLRYRLSA